MGHAHRDDCCCGDDAAARVEQALVRVRAAGLRVTEARRALLRALAASKVPLPVDEIHRRSGRGKSDRVTVYRNLEALERAGIVRLHPLEKGRSLYALETPGHHHHHVVCRACGAIERLEACDAGPVEAGARAKGYTRLTHVLEVHGLCPRCSHG
jgi:Fur family ferric uptake transcriptional regulator